MLIMVQKTKSRSSVADVYRETERLLIERIQTGVYPNGEWLPTERALTEELNVNRRVIRNATAHLEQMGLLTRRPNCRPTVQYTPGQPAVGSGKHVHNQFPASRLVALVMWHGGLLEQGLSAQQRIFWGINQCLGQAGYHTVLLDLGSKIGSEEENSRIEAENLTYARQNGFGGVIFYSYAYRRNRELVQSIAHSMPLVLIDRNIAGVEADYVGVANEQAMYEATTYAISKGHKKIAYLTKCEPINTVNDRASGFLRCFHETFGQKQEEIIILLPTMIDWETWPIFDYVFTQPVENRPTAVVCVNDYDAVNAANRLAYLGLSVPEDVSIIGCDDIIQRLPNGVGLTTIAQPFEEIGNEAANLFLKRIDNPTLMPQYIDSVAEIS
jgi:DNA-binding LacI/PurR family transcriptional regulator